MKKAKAKEMREEYKREDFGPGVRDKYLEEYRAGTNLVLPSPEAPSTDIVGATPWRGAFPRKAVNEALRSLIKVAQRTVRPPKRSPRRAPKRSR